MGTGTEPYPQGAQLVQASLVGTYTVDREAGSPPIDTNCSQLNRETIDKCFLPGIGLTSQNDDGTVGCSGTIVGPRHVLTAAHCLCIGGSIEPLVPGGVLVGTHGYSGAYYTSSPTLGDSVRILGEYAAPGKASVIFAIENVKVFGNYCGNKEAINDVALLTVKMEGAFPPELQARLTVPPPLGSIVNLTGFGRDLEDGQAEIFNIKRYLSATYAGMDNRLLQIQSAHGDSCRGDSGSGAYFRHADGSLLIFGVLSRGDRKCQQAIPATYIDISDAHYAKLFETLPSFMSMKVPYNPPEDAGTCIGDGCERGDWAAASN